MPKWVKKMTDHPFFPAFLISLFFLTTLSFQPAKGQTFDVDTLQYNGPSEKMVDLVILADGYTAEEQDKFIADARTMADYILGERPFSAYRNLFNVFIVKVLSNESGAKHPGHAPDCPEDIPENRRDNPRDYHSKIYIPNSNPDNYFGSSFDSYGIHRLVVSTKEDLVIKVLEANTPFYDQAFVLVNSPYYGGSGGRIPTATANVQSNAIAIHELAHSFAGLADEYWAGVQYAAEGTNMSRQVSPERVPWKKWLGTDGVGIYPYGPKAPQSVWFRPHEYCKMQTLAAPFCPVCSEALVHRIQRLVNPVTRMLPEASDIIVLDSARYFALHINRPEPNSLETTWYLNGVQISAAPDSILVDPALLAPGENLLTARLNDTTTFVRSHPRAEYHYEWRIAPGSGSLAVLKAPTTRWGDTVEACYGYGTAFSILEPTAGVEYDWYEQKEGGQPISTGIDMVTSPLFEDTTFYVASRWADQHSARTALYVRVLPMPDAPAFKIEKAEGDILRVIIENPVRGHEFRWYMSADSPKPISYSDWGAPYYISTEDGGKVLNIRRPPGKYSLYVETINARTTCPGPRVRVDISLD